MTERDERHAQPEYDLAAVRRELPVLQEWTYLGTGTQGIMAEPVLQRHLERIAAFERGGTAMPGRVEAEANYQACRESVARLIGAEANDVALLRNASDGINIVTAAIDLQPGDEIITSTAEGLELIIPLVGLCARTGAALRYIELTPDPAEFAARLEALLSDRTRLIILSQVSCEWGTRVPVEIMRELAGPEVLIVVDGAQSVGQFAVDVTALNADVFISNGHKWLCGPKGTGFSWFSTDVYDKLPPVMFGYESADPVWERHYYQQEPAPAFGFRRAAERYEFGTRSWHLFGGLADAIDYQAELGWQAIFDHSRTMSDYAKASLGELPGVDIVTPLGWEDASGFVTFTVEGYEGHELRDRLRDEFQITQRSTEIPSAVRVGCAYFTAREDIDALVAALRQITGVT